MGVEVPLKRAMSVRRPKLVIDERTVELHAPSTLQQPLVLPRADVAGVWPVSDLEQVADTVPFWVFHGLGVDVPDFGLVLRRAVAPPPVKKLYHRDLIHPTAKILLFAVADPTQAAEAFRQAGLPILDEPVDRF